MHYNSLSTFKNSCAEILDIQPKNLYLPLIKASCFTSPVGPMLAIADEKALFLLEFAGRKNLSSAIEKLGIQTKSTIVFGETAPINNIKKELDAYFAGVLKHFKTPIHILGSTFQKEVWHALLNIPYGYTKSYGEQAITIGKPSAPRAVANANGKNQLALIIPCHRIIRNNGDLGGYGGGIEKKAWLLEHEKKYR